MALTLTPPERDSIYLVTGTTHPRLASLTAKKMATQLDGVEHKTFPNTEKYLRYSESVRGKHVFIMQTMTAVETQSVNDSFVEALLMIDAARRGSASEVTIVAPLLGYARQDRKTQGRDPVSAALVVDLLVRSGADRVMSVDVHSPVGQAVTNKPFDQLTAKGLIKAALRREVGKNYASFLIVSPDAGRAKASEEYGEELGIDVAHMPKLRDRGNSAKIRRPNLGLEISGRTCIVIDDMIDTAGTLVSAVEALKEAGAGRVITAATHGIFSEPALERLKNSSIDLLIITDTVPQKEAKKVLGKRLKVVSVDGLLAKAIKEVATGGSVSRIFQGRNYS